ncbi:hypothetical protein GGR50DRAFT_697156 [Xylaria sp. CBS 124048]|nr:hypothetical protein GGR50DRAFT_697156 [Xylaria sp. CBS 124048]
MSAVMDLSQNYSLYAIPIAWFFTFVTGSYAKTLSSGHYDIAYPRRYAEAVEKDEKLSKATKDKIFRCEGAAANGRETLSLFAGAVLSANYAKVPVETINTLVAAYLASRVVYNIVYVHLQENRKFAPLRSLSWMFGIGVCITLFVKAGSNL